MNARYSHTRCQLNFSRQPINATDLIIISGCRQAKWIGLDWFGVEPSGVESWFYFSPRVGIKIMANCYFCICRQAAACMSFDQTESEREPYIII